ncbi:O-antigen ligase family protein [uncultured Nocardioides sp.]|uniref:O-antigen ligase family protein n=1 Tax=uncultured Nocardioides sp. TaxID=198441 RepID=UPI00262ED7DE|nr:O-antigen ligase family protein [uncultured Nocardioides sp.]
MKSRTASGDGNLRGLTRLRLIVLLYPLGAAVFNPGTGLTSGMYATIPIIVVYVFRRLTSPRPVASYEVLLLLSSAIVLASPFWTGHLVAGDTSASRGAALSILYAIAAIEFIRTRQQLIFTLQTLAAGGTLYAAYFLTRSEAYDNATNRATVEFANANYTGAILAFTAVCTLHLVRDAGWSWRVALVAATAVQSGAILATGSRASISGAIIGILFLLRSERPTRFRDAAVFFGMAAFGVLPFLASLESRLREIAVWAGQFDSRERAASSRNLSGRDALWEQSLQLLPDQLLTGWGPDRYRFRLPSQGLTHNWVLELLLSVGVLGTFVVVAAIVVTYRGPSARNAATQFSALRPAVAMSIIPSLGLSTHQWTLWAWFALAICFLTGPGFDKHGDASAAPADETGSNVNRASLGGPVEAAS